VCVCVCVSERVHACLYVCAFPMNVSKGCMHVCTCACFTVSPRAQYTSLLRAYLPACYNRLDAIRRVKYANVIMWCLYYCLCVH